MNMLAGMLGGLVDKEKITHDTIQECLENICEELNENKHPEDFLSFKDFFIMIKPVDEEFEMKFFIYKLSNGKPEFVREITLKEILGQ